MRKQVVDGSNTSGFQRTTLIGTTGKIDDESRRCRGWRSLYWRRILHASWIPREPLLVRRVFYILDRLGVPLVEIATDPDIIDPDHAMETARAIGTLLRSTRSVRRGLGSIRQDLNVSLACGDRVEIKGTQDLEWIPRIVRLEMARQLHFYRLANELRSEAGLPPLPPNRDDDDASTEASVLEKADFSSSVSTRRFDGTLCGLNVKHGRARPGFRKPHACRSLAPGFRQDRLGSKNSG
ncbi:MAG: hypothetical protein ACJZ59_07250 [Candidatus Thalassarchaeaceae archaeon]